MEINGDVTMETDKQTESENRASLDKAPRLSIRIVIWILPSVFVNSIEYQQIMRRQGYLELSRHMVS